MERTSLVPMPKKKTRRRHKKKKKLKLNTKINRGQLIALDINSFLECNDEILLLISKVFSEFQRQKMKF